MGVLEKPVWCPGEKLINMSIYQNILLYNNKSSDFVVHLKIETSPPQLLATGNQFGTVACESL